MYEKCEPMTKPDMPKHLGFAQEIYSGMMQFNAEQQREILSQVKERIISEYLNRKAECEAEAKHLQEKVSIISGEYNNKPQNVY